MASGVAQLRGGNIKMCDATRSRILSGVHVNKNSNDLG